MPLQMPPMPRLVRTLPLLLPLALGGCGMFAGGPAPSDFPPSCPHLALLKDAADMTRFDARGHDVTDVVLDGQMTAVPASCTWGPHASVSATLRVQMSVGRGPAAQGRTAEVPYFVAVSRNGQVVDKQVYRMHAVFPANVERVNLTSDPIALAFPDSAAAPASSYQVFVGFQLTPAELQYNRNRGPR